MVAVVWLVVFGVTGSIPKRDAHIYIYRYIYIYTLSENRVQIICLALRRSATTVVAQWHSIRWLVAVLTLLSDLRFNYCFIGASLSELYTSESNNTIVMVVAFTNTFKIG